MAELKVNGLRQLEKNLADFGDDKIIGRIVKAAMAAGARAVLPRGKSNAEALGLGAQGMVTRPQPKSGRRPREYAVYGRIPKSLKVGRAYIPKGKPNLYRVNVVARGQRRKGIFADKAPHAHFIEYGFNHKASGRHIAARPYLGPALNATAQQAIDRIAATMERRVNRLRFPQ